MTFFKLDALRSVGLDHKMIIVEHLIFNTVCSAKYGRRAEMMKRSDYIKPNGLGWYIKTNSTVGTETFWNNEDDIENIGIRDRM